jgi:hypothetical protein
MLTKTFKSRLSKLSSKKKDDNVVLEFVLTHTSEETVQDFLSSLDTAYNLSLRHPFTSDVINWKRITFDVSIPLLVVEFESLKMNAILLGINVVRREVEGGEVFKYDLIFNKSHDPDIDSVFAITFLNRKEEDENNKKVFLEYDTVVKNLNQ